jgi:hypothetical protein
MSNWRGEGGFEVKFVHLASVIIAGAIVVAALPAEAQSRRIRTNNWRKRDRGSGIYQGTPQRFAFELRFGPYYPAVDEEFGGSGPYNRYFGDSGRFHFGTEFDWQALRIPWVGTFGPGVGIGYTSATAKGFAEGVLDTPTTDDNDRKGETSLMIAPMHLSAVIRLDELFRRTGFPVVPYAKLGLGVGLWWVNSGEEQAKVTTNGKEVLGRGTSYGVHWALGGMLALDFLGRREMSALDQETGVNHVHLFGEWMNQNLGLGTGQMHVGTSTFMGGLTFEM